MSMELTDLTRPELDVLRLVADGLEPPEIAAKLSCSERTVKSLLRGVMQRHGFRSRAHAVCYTMRAGLI